MQRSIRRRKLGPSAAIGIAVAVVVGGAITWSARQAGAERALGGAVLSNVAGEVVGRATFTQAGRAVRVEVAVERLPPGFHGFHVHAVGLCDAGGGFASAGGHVNPGGHNHAEHAGDQPSLYVMADSTGALSFLTDRASVDELLGGEPRALVVHASPDNFANIPARYAPDGPDAMTHATGDAGARIACGVIAEAAR